MSKQQTKMDPRKIKVVEGFNTRVNNYDDRKSWEQFKANILSRGVVMPLLVFEEKDQIYLSSQGHRRLAAVRELLKEHPKAQTIQEVPIQFDNLGEDVDSRTLDIVALNSAKPLEILEEARVYQRLVDGKFPKGDGTPEMFPKELKEARNTYIEALAEKTGKSITHIKNCLALCECPQSVIRKIESGRITASLVIELIKECKGDYAKVETKVEQALAKANQSGKQRASRKHVDEEGGGNSESEGSGKTNVSDAKLAKRIASLNKMLESTDRETSNSSMYDMVEAVLNYLEGETDIKPVRSLVRE